MACAIPETRNPAWISGQLQPAAAFLIGNPRAVAAPPGQIVVGTWGGDYGQLLSELVDEPLASASGVEVLQDVANADPRKTK